jgi:hypothetical protein
MKRHLPPLRSSSLSTVLTGAMDLGPHQRATCSGVVNTFHTSDTGASKLRVQIIEGSSLG